MSLSVYMRVELADSEMLTYRKIIEAENSEFRLYSNLTDGRHRARAAGIKLFKCCNTVAMSTVEWSVGYGRGN